MAQKENLRVTKFLPFTCCRLLKQTNEITRFNEAPPLLHSALASPK